MLLPDPTNKDSLFNKMPIWAFPQARNHGAEEEDQGSLDGLCGQPTVP
jgi:hypothetical protein